MTDDQTTDLYRFFDADGQLLYIGISLHAAHRASEHKRSQPWWPAMDHMDVEHLRCGRAEALQIERDAIEREKPMHNVVHNHRALPTVIIWRCDVCRAEIDDDDGYIELPPAERARYRKEREAWDALVAKDKSDRAGDDPDEIQFVNLALVLAAPSPPKWIVVHRSCDPSPDRTGYWFGVERCRTIIELVDWTAHLMEKRWLHETTWVDLMRRAVASAVT